MKISAYTKLITRKSLAVVFVAGLLLILGSYLYSEYGVSQQRKALSAHLTALQRAYNERDVAVSKLMSAAAKQPSLCSRYADALSKAHRDLEKQNLGAASVSKSGTGIEAYKGALVKYDSVLERALWQAAREPNLKTRAMLKPLVMDAVKCDEAVSQAQATEAQVAQSFDNVLRNGGPRAYAVAEPPANGSVAIIIQKSH